ASLLERVIGAELVAAHVAADAAARKYATMVSGLRSGELELQPWIATESGAELNLAVVVKGYAQRSLGLWPIVPLLIIGAVVGAGVYLTHAWLSLRTLEA